MDVIIPGGLQSVVLAGEIAPDVLLERIYQVIRQSFADDHARAHLLGPAPYTDAEVHRRVQLCADLVGTMRHELGYTIARCLTALPRALRARLDGEDPFVKPARALYGVPGRGREETADLSRDLRNREGDS